MTVTIRNTALNEQLVVTVLQAQVVRTIRNACRGTFTHHNEYITESQQLDWWQHRGEGVRVWLYGCPPEWFGFGMLRPDDNGHVWATLAVLPAYRNIGFGTAIYRHLLEQEEHVWIEIGTGNPASYQAARKAGFMPVATERDDVLVLVAVKGSEGLA
jgi:GNAT superfamily N-acetyltransferase